MSEKTKRNRRDTRKDQEIRTRCRSRLKEKGSSLGEYRRTQGNPSTMSEKRSYLGEVPKKRLYLGKYRRIQDRWEIESEQVPENPRQKGLYPSEYWRRVRASIEKGSGRVPKKGMGEY